MRLSVPGLAAAVMAAGSSACLADVLNAHPGPANNGGATGWAIFFDLEAFTPGTMVTHMTSANTGAANAPFTVEVFVRTGTALGGPVGAGPGSSSAGWTSLGIVPAVQGPVASGVSQLIDIPDISVAVGGITGVAVRFTGVGPRYFGTGTPPLSIFQDANLKLTTGDARSVPFTTGGTFFTSRALVGALTYVIPAPSGAALLALAGLAAARRRR